MLFSTRKVERNWFVLSGILVGCSLLSIIISRNENWFFFLMRSFRYCASSYIILFLIAQTDVRRLKKVSLTVALTHTLIIIISFFWQPLNALLHVVLSKSTVLSTERSSGLFEGYDYAAYFLTIFYANYALENIKGLKTYVTLTLGLLALIITGRTGLFFAVIIMVVFMLKNRLFFSPVALVVFGLIGLIFFNKILYAIYSVGLIDKGDYYKKADGYYDMSFFQVLAEWNYLIDNFFKVIFGSSQEFRGDPGPVFIISNLGILAYIAYLVTFIKGNHLKRNKRGVVNIIILMVAEFKINVLLSRSVSEYSLLINLAEKKKLDETDSTAGG